MNCVENNGNPNYQPTDNEPSTDNESKALFDKIYQKHSELDKNKDGKVDISELSDGLDKGEISLTELLSLINNAQADKAASSSTSGDAKNGNSNEQVQPQNPAPVNSPSEVPVDENGDGEIDASEFMKAFDKNNDGKLNTQELSNGLQALGLGAGMKAQ